MKKSFFWTLAVVTALSCGFVSCGDDDDDNKKATTTTNTDNGNKQGNDSTKTDSTKTVIYRTPLLTWGATKANVKAYMNGYTILDEDDEYIAFEGKDLETDQLYFFNEKGALSEADVYVSYDNTTAGDLTKQIVSEGFAYLGVKDSLTYYINSDTTTIACLIAMPYYKEYCVAYWNNVREEVTASYFELPYLNWGCSRDSVKAAMEARGYELAEEYPDDADNDYPIYYYGKVKEYFSIYGFDKAKKLDYVSVAFETATATFDELEANLKEFGYKFIAEQEGARYYATADYADVACLYSGKSANYILFYAYPSSSRSMDAKTCVNDMKQMVKSAKQNEKTINLGHRFGMRKAHKLNLK